MNREASRLGDVAEIGPDFPVAANRALGRLRAIYWALENDLVVTDPTHGVKKPTKEKPVSRTLSDEDLAKIWNVAASLSYPAREYIRFLILPGQRRDDVRGMRREELDMRMGNWVIPADRYKNGRSHLIPLTDGMKELLKVTPVKGFVFSDRWGEALWELGQAKAQARQAFSREELDAARHSPDGLNRPFAARGTPRHCG